MCFWPSIVLPKHYFWNLNLKKKFWPHIQLSDNRGKLSFNQFRVYACSVRRVSQPLIYFESRITFIIHQLSIFFMLSLDRSHLLAENPSSNGDPSTGMSRSTISKQRILNCVAREPGNFFKCWIWISKAPHNLNLLIWK